MGKSMGKSFLDDAYEMLDEVRRKASKDWIREESEKVRKTSARARSTGEPVVTASQVISVSIVGRRHFLPLLGKAFDVLFEGRTTMRFRKRQ